MDVEARAGKGANSDGGAEEGLSLIHILPTLLPFMICSGVIVALDGVGLLTRPFAPFFSGLLKLSPNGCFVLMSGLLCGYPMGAKTDSEFLDSRRISPAQARYLLAIANHPSPMLSLIHISPGRRTRSGPGIRRRCASTSTWRDVYKRPQSQSPPPGRPCRTRCV